MTRTLEALTAEYVALYALDVREFPTCYKSHVVADPEAAARGIIDGLEAKDVAGWIRDLKAERRAVARA